MSHCRTSRGLRSPLRLERGFFCNSQLQAHLSPSRLLQLSDVALELSHQQALSLNRGLKGPTLVCDEIYNYGLAPIKALEGGHTLGNTVRHLTCRQHDGA